MRGQSRAVTHPPKCPTLRTAGKNLYSIVNENKAVISGFIFTIAASTLLFYFGIKNYDKVYSKHKPAVNATRTDIAKAYKAAQISFLPFLAGFIVLLAPIVMIGCYKIIKDRKSNTSDGQNNTSSERRGKGCLSLFTTMRPPPCSSPCYSTALGDKFKFTLSKLHPKRLGIHTFIAKYKTPLLGTLIYATGMTLLFVFGLKHYDTVNHQKGFHAAQKSFGPYLGGVLALTALYVIAAVTYYKKCNNTSASTRNQNVEMRRTEGNVDTHTGLTIGGGTSTRYGAC